jgi:hypothetical protein
MTRTGLATEHLDRLRSCSSDRIDAAGDFLCREGETADIDDSVPARGWPCS